MMAGATRFELATSGVTGRHSNQLNYAPVFFCLFRFLYPPACPEDWWAVQDSNL